MEARMLILYQTMNRSINVYTMDHRGTGRSGYLQCEAAQALTEGSPGGTSLKLEELVNCVCDVLFEIDDHTAAYSVTSAARDVVTLLTRLEDKAEYPEEESRVFLYGVSYGTYLVERIMHLAPPQIKGYIVDGVLSETGFSALEWNKNILPPTQRFFEACFDSPTCPLHLKSRETVLDEVLEMYKEIDAAIDSNACASGLVFVMMDVTTNEVTPSEALRMIFGLIARDLYWRTLIPSLLLRVHRCNDSDFKELQAIYQILQKQLTAQFGITASIPFAGPVDMRILLQPNIKPKFLDLSLTSTPSEMLYYLITFSELWPLPMPDYDTLTDAFENGPFAVDVDILPAYCLVTGGFNNDSHISTCKQLRDALEESEDGFDAIPTIETPFLYEPDQYWNSTATLPEDVGVLVMVGGFDFQTPSELGKREYHELHTKNKMLVEFTYGAHGPGFLPTSPNDGPLILTSFIQNDGNVEHVETGCLERLPDLEFDDHAFLELLEQVEMIVDTPPQ